MSEQYDFIVVGAGSAGSVLANRLSAEPSRSVLLIEEGPPDDHRMIHVPKGFGRLLADPRYVSYQPTLHDRGPKGPPEVWARGKTLGGSSSVNGMVWIRGQPQDYDDFEALGAIGWGWAQIAPYFERIENHRSGLGYGRGIGGPIEVATHPRRSELAEAFIAAGQQLGLRRKSDQNESQQEGIGYLQLNIDSKGRRCSAARGFLDPVRHRSNLRILTDTRVDRVNFTGKKAASVTCTCRGERKRFEARAEIILSAGGLYSPRLLQLSGVGPGNHLRSLGIDVVHDNENVGLNLREHWLLGLQFRLRHWRDSENREYSGLRLFRNVLRYLLGGTGVLSYGSHDAAAFVRSRPLQSRPDAQLMLMPSSLDRHNGFRFESEAGMQIFAYALRPESRGSLRIATPDPGQPSTINPNYLSAESDRQVSVAAVRFIRKLAARDPLAKLIVNETSDTADALSDEQILDAFRRMGHAGYHASSTCAMGSGTAVLDARARVRGVENLRVVDTSMFPAMISGNTNAPVMAMAWRAADLITEDHRPSR